MLLAVLLVLILSSLSAGSAAAIAHAKGRSDAVTLVAALGLLAGPLGPLVASFVEDAEMVARRARMKAERAARKEAERAAK